MVMACLNCKLTMTHFVRGLVYGRKMESSEPRFQDPIERTQFSIGASRMSNLSLANRFRRSCEAFLVCIFLVSCGGGIPAGTTTQAAGTPASPTVVSISPSRNANNVVVSTAITATFSQNMDTSTINAATFTLSNGTTNVPGTVTYNGTTATFTPSITLALGATYTATITNGVRDAAGNAMSNNYSWSFTTVTPPTVTSTLPSGTGVALNTSITATFSRNMDSSTINPTTFTLKDSGNNVVNGNFSFTGTTATTAIFAPTNPLAPSTLYNVSITTGVKDLAGNAMASNCTNCNWSFTTGLSIDTTHPTVTATTPLDTATDVALNGVVTATFSEYMNPSTISPTTFTLSNGATNVPGTVTYSGTTATFIPSSNLTYSATYTATITSGVTDLEGNNLITPKVWTFTVSAAPPATGQSNLMGINIGAPLYYEGDRLYADVVRMSDIFTGGTVGADGWPTSDFSFLVWNNMVAMDGTYTLTFAGQATVQANGSSLATTYDSATNTSTGTLQFANSATSALTLSFAGTKRSSGSALNSGVTSIKLMRPLIPGSSTSYTSTTLFTTPIKNLIAKFSVIRFMDFLATNTSLHVNWSDRLLPTSPSFNRYPTGAAYTKYTSEGGWQGYGGPWEHVIQLSNETGKDAWINIPMHATDDYILKVAQMFKYGSDGVTPYTSPQSNPAYPPLSANLNVYVEYSNELWNGIFQQTSDNCQAASDALVAGLAAGTALNWDSTWNHIAYNPATAQTSGWNWTFCDRQTTKRSVEISNIFRTVFGSEMGTRIRPVLMSQLYNSGATLFNQTQMLFNYYNNMGGNFVSSPHPPNYYFFGAGGSGYYAPAPTVSTLSAFFADPGFTPAGMRTYFLDDEKLVAAMGLKRIAYEGGPDLALLGGARDSIYLSAVNDARMTTAIVNMHNEWSNDGGDLFVYYRATGYRATAYSADDMQWGFTLDVNNLASRKLQAIDALNLANRAPLTFGTAVPGTISGGAADACSTNWGCSINSFTANGVDNIWASYTFRSSVSSNRTVDLTFTAASSASVAVYIDGSQVDVAKSTTGGALSFNAGTIGTGLHSVIVRAAAGSFSLSSVALN
jgi:hypothetical protein